MSEKKEKSDYIEARIIGGEYRYTCKDILIGYCHFPEHKGHITKNVLKKKECVKKECFYFQKFEDNPYWEAVAQREASQKNKRDAQKQKKKKDEEKQEKLVKQVQRMADGLGYSIKVYRVKKLTVENEYAIYYTSDKGYNDYYDYFELAIKFGRIVKCKVRLKHIKDIDGNYAVMKNTQ